MKIKTRQFDKRRGAALILVIVVTVLLAVIGVMFLMTSRLSEMETAAVAGSRDLDSGVQAVVGRINEVLVEDLFGNDGRLLNADTANLDAHETSDYPIHNDVGPDGVYGTADDVFIDPKTNGYNEPLPNDDFWLPGTLDDYWLASLEPVWSDRGRDGLTGNKTTMADDTYVWPHITDLWGSLQGTENSLFYQQYDLANHRKFFQQNPVDKQWIDPDYTSNATENTYGDGWNTQTLWDKWQVSAYNVRAKVITAKDRAEVVAVGNNIDADIDGGTQSYPNPWEDATYVSPFGARADADGDGVADSRWVPIPNLNTTRGEPIYAAVRIIDNCGMLNLNAAHCFYQNSYTSNISPFRTPWYASLADLTAGTAYHNNLDGSGRYLTEINYMPFLRGHDLNGNYYDGTSTAGDDWYNLMIEKGFVNTGTGVPDSPKDVHTVLMDIEDPGNAYHFFDLSNELEIRNRYLQTSHSEALFEQEGVAHFSFDADAAAYAALETPRVETDFDIWKYRIDSDQFHRWNAAGALRTTADPLSPYFYRYDRRHACTFYSFDRVVRKGDYPLLASEIAAYIATGPTVPAIFSSMAEYEDSLWDVFTPQGAVTTNIEDVMAAEPYNNIETRKRILHLLYALREHYYASNGGNLNAAALRAAQVVANMIDFSDDISPNTNSFGETQGPFYNPQFASGVFTIDYGQQANVDSTFLTRDMMGQMLTEASQNILGAGNEIDYLGSPAVYGDFEFGLEPNPNTTIVANDIVFGYERQPFISEVYVNWNPSPPAAAGTELDTLAIELVNPYSTPINLIGWTLNIGVAGATYTHTFVAAGTGGTPGTNTTAVPAYAAATGLGRLVINFNPATLAPPAGVLSYDVPLVNLPLIQQGIVTGGDNIDLLRPAPTTIPAGWGFTVVDLAVDHVANVDLLRVVGTTFPGLNSLKRSDVDWEFVYGRYLAQNAATFTNTIGLANGAVVTTPAIPAGQQLQLAARDDQLPLARWHDLETLALFGYDDAAAATPFSITEKITAGGTRYFDLAGTSSSVLDYLCTMNRPDKGTLPGRININTAPVHVIAAAIPPVLTDPATTTTVASTYSALDLAQDIVNGRPYSKLADLLANVPRLRQYDTGGVFATTNVGQQSIDDDIEEEHWILSNLANKFTVRSDVFTAYILVRLGTDGPQRRMIAIFDRSHVNDANDRPQLLSLHPVPDPR